MATKKKTNEIDKDVFRNLSDIEFQIKQLEEARVLLRAKCVLEIEKAGLDKIDSEFGTFTLFTRVAWQYPESLKAEVQDMYSQARLSGKATRKEQKVLLFKATKKEE